MRAQKHVQEVATPFLFLIFWGQDIKINQKYYGFVKFTTKNR